MKRFISFLKILLVLIVTFFLMTACSSTRKPYCPTYAGTIEPVTIIPASMELRYDTTIIFPPDSTYYHTPYRFSQAEKIGLTIMAGFCYWAFTSHNK